MKFIIALGLFTAATLFAQPTPEPKTDVSNKALITKVTPAATKGGGDVAALRKLADEFYAWRNENFPVNASDAGLHTWDNRLTDYSAGKIAERNQHVRKLLDQVRAMPGAKWPKDDRIDWMLFRAQLENYDFGSRVLQSEKADPQLYVGECASGIFSLLKKEYDAPRTRALAATERLKQMPAMLAQGERNLQKPVKLFARLAIDSARAIDPLLKDSLMTLARDMPANERDALVKARDEALTAIHGFADRLEKRLSSMVDFAPMGAANEKLGLRFGVEMSKGYTGDPSNFDVESGNEGFITYNRENKLLADHSITRGRNSNENISRIIAFTGQSLKGPAGSVAFMKLSDTAVDLISTGQGSERRQASAAGRAQGIAFRLDKGRVVVLGEAAMLSAQLAGPQKMKFGMNRPGIDNRQLALNIMHWLSGLLN